MLEQGAVREAITKYVKTMELVPQGENSNLGNHHSPLYQLHVGIYPGYGFYNNSVWIFLHLLEPNGICILMAERQSTYMYTVLLF